MSRFKHRKFDITCDSNGTNSWVPVEQAKALLCDAMAVEAENAALAAEKEALVQQGIRDHGDWRSKLNFLEADYKAEVARLTAENERLRKACELVFGEAAKRKFLMCYPGDDFYVSLEAMQEMKNALGYNAAKEARDAK